MGENGFTAVIFILLLVSNTCNASSVFHLRKLISSEFKDASANSQVSPTGSAVAESKINPVNAGKSQEEKHKEAEMGSPNNDKTLPIDSNGLKKNNNATENPGTPSPPAGGKNGNSVDRGNGKADSTTTTKLGNNGICEGSLTRRYLKLDKPHIMSTPRVMKLMLTLMIFGVPPRAKQLFLVVQNEGESTLKVNVNLPNLENALPAFEVSKHKNRRMDISSIVGKNSELIVNSGSAKCELHLVNPVSVDNLMRQLSFYSKQVTPIYAVYASSLLVLLLGGTWACCKFRKRSRQEGIPYQELEMGFPETASAVNLDVAEGWDHDWDDDWDEDTAVKSPIGPQVRNFSADGLTARSAKIDGKKTRKIKNTCSTMGN
ncbi:UNVERIFIED_CONTAM: hypothetical protein Sradi_5950400 [Sesamum radiatum]|uniref:DUF7356 domain-containing protein n=1 Tax=Sesamum radiatum TaxID=300843 RepID=A0AAW2KT22_SESRA